jgi:predicted nucleic acid-binding protein
MVERTAARGKGKPAAPLRPLHVAEPSPPYGQRLPVVVDASVICAVVFAEPEADAALQRIRHHALVAPDLLPYEVSNVALMKHRRGAPMPDMRAGLVRCLELELLLEPTDALQRLEIAARYGLSAYDAAYLWLAEATQAPLITFDARLAEAARRHLGPQGHGATQ